MKTAISMLAAAMMLTACASGGYRPAYQIREILVVNNSQQLLREVSIRSGDRVFACGNIPALRICSNSFPRRNYDYAPIEVEWTLGQNAPRKQSLSLEVPATYATGLPLRGVLEIGSDGNISAHFEQETPMR